QQHVDHQEPVDALGDLGEQSARATGWRHCSSWRRAGLRRCDGTPSCPKLSVHVESQLHECYLRPVRRRVGSVVPLGANAEVVGHSTKLGAPTSSFRELLDLSHTDRYVRRQSESLTKLSATRAA